MRLEFERRRNALRVVDMPGGLNVFAQSPETDGLEPFPENREARGRWLSAIVRLEARLVTKYPLIDN